MMTSMEHFQQAFDKMNVNTAVMGQQMNNFQDAGSVQNTEDLMNQLKNEVAYEMNKDLPDAAKIITANTQKEKPNDEMDRFLEDLKK